MEINNKNMCQWEITKGAFLISQASALGMNVTGYGLLDVDQNSGNTYLWLEDYPFTLFMPISCDLEKTAIYAIWSDFNNGDDTELALSDNTTLEDLYNWVESLEESMTDE